MDNRNAKRASILLLITFIVAMAGAGLALTLHWLIDTSFMPWTNYISDLSVGPNGSNIVFIIMMLGMAVALAPFFLFLARELKSRYNVHCPATFALITGIVGCIDTIVMVFFPLDASKPVIYNIHIITGIIIFLCMTCYLGAYGWVFLKKTNFPNILSILACAASLCSFVFAILLALTELFDVLNQSAIIYLIEWAAFGFFAVWQILTSLHLRKTPAE